MTTQQLQSCRTTTACYKGPGLFLPTRPVTASPSLFRIECLAAEPLHEFVGITCFGEAVDVEPPAVVENRMTARAKRQILTESMDHLVPTLLTRACRKRDLMRPISIDRGGRQLALTVDHAACVSAKSSGTSPKVFRITASSNSPRLRSPLLEKATAVIDGHRLSAPDGGGAAWALDGLSGREPAFHMNKGQRHVIDHHGLPYFLAGVSSWQEYQNKMRTRVKCRWRRVGRGPGGGAGRLRQVRGDLPAAGAEEAHEGLSVVRDFETGGGLNQERVWRIMVDVTRLVCGEATNGFGWSCV